jgi:5-formyltetrahydrofolate cyclo-ligase
LIDPDGTAQGKRELRASLRQQRLALPAAQRMSAAESVATLLLEHPAFPASGYVAGYWAMGGELPLHVLQMRLGPERIWCLPCIQDDGSLQFSPWAPGDELVSNRFGIPEPTLSATSSLPASAMAAVLLPLLGFTRAGDRLGMGGGYYDRSLAFRANQPAPPLLVGVGYAFQQLDALAVAPWDVGLDAIVTERELILR